MQRGAAGSDADRLAEAIASEIREGVMPPSAVLPTAERLAIDMMLDAAVVQSGYEQLARAGLLRVRSDGRVCVVGTARGPADEKARGATIVPFSRVGRPDNNPGDAD
jgi:DNA-binding transcriptional regulator YhcF (GntR family)